MDLTIKLNDASLQSIERMSAYPSILEPQLHFAMEHSVELLRKKAIDFADSEFQQTTGRFTGSLQTVVDSPYQAQLWSDAPYAQRLEFGFSGMTDSLGRYFARWPGGSRTEYYRGYRWATHTVEDAKKDIQDVFEVAIDYANWQLGRITV